MFSVGKYLMNGVRCDVNKLQVIMGMYEEIISLMKVGAQKERFVSLLKEVTKAEVELYNEMYGVLNIIRAGVISAIMEQTLNTLKSRELYDEKMGECLKGAMGSMCFTTKRGSE